MAKVALPVKRTGKKVSNGTYRGDRKPNSKWVKNGMVKPKKK